MFCVIQTIQRKKGDPHGDYREYEVSSMTIGFPDGTSKTHYSYYPNYEAGHFERPRREAYRISIHESRREGGRVVKKQCAIATIGYYDFADRFSLYDYIDAGINRAVDVFNADYEALFSLVEQKVQPLAEKIEKEFHKSEEYKAHRQREKIEKTHQKAKKKFGEQYGVDPDEYDYCYNIFGELMEKEYLEQIIRQYERRKEAYSSYRESWGSNYGGGSSSSYSISVSSTYSEKETDMLKEFYKKLSKIYHPDLNPGTDTTAQMQLLNRLKESWKI